MMKKPEEAGLSARPSRRAILKSGAGLSAMAPFFLSSAAYAQEAAGADAGLASVQNAERVLLKGGVVLTLDPQIGDFETADVMIEGGRIAAIAPEIAATDASIALVDATNRIVIPGFIDTHHHFYQGVIRNILTNGLLNPDYSRDVSDRLTAVYNPPDVYAGTLATALGMIENGTTTAVDTSQVNHTPEHSDAAIAAHRESGLRTVYAFSRGAGPEARYPQDLLRLREAYFNTDDQILKLALAANLNAEQFGFAREAGVNTVCHGINDRNEPLLMELWRAGLLAEGDEYIHCTHLSRESWSAIRESGGRVSAAVPIEMAMGHGMPPIQDALDNGVRPSLSTDVDVTMAQDLFTVMRAAFTLQRLMVLQRIRNGEQNTPPLLTCREVLEFATIEGARCVGMEDRIGTLTPGKDADIVMLQADRLNVWPLNNVPGTIVNLMNPSHVHTVFINGRVKKWRGALAGADVARVVRLAEESRDGVVARAGYERDLFG
jgi:5-methylthioadenosine/S-adenosylhomocysteine deaminase